MTSHFFKKVLTFLNKQEQNVYNQCQHVLFINETLLQVTPKKAKDIDMGNQASIPPASRTTSVLPPHIPSQVPLPTPSRRERRYSEQESRGRGSIGTGSVPISGRRKLSGENGTPGTYETPPCINVKVGEISADHFDETVFLV